MHYTQIRVRCQCGDERFLKSITRYVTYPDKEFFAIRKRFEEFLGRPIRPYEEIVRAQREREQQLKRERLGPIADDMKIDTGDL